ncbi:hypothetical protein LBMAG42_12020 [Deltaproteobacteria bacterium]|nr:hypothetical protein LBMAG42_12020 [Deltaproteobacteria bacterium]
MRRIPRFRGCFAALGLLVAGYVVLRMFAGVASAVSSRFAANPTTSPGRVAELWFLLAFPLFFAPLLYGGLCLLARRRLPLHAEPLVAAAGVTFLCAATAEIAVDSAFVALTGAPAWRYIVWPVHQGYTSGIGIVMWPLYGAFVHLLHEVLRGDPRFRAVSGDIARGVLIAADAMLLEVAANLFSLVVFGCFTFYYLPDDLLHFTTIRIFLPYCAVGVLGVQVLNRLEGVRGAAWAGGLAWAVAACVVLAGPS